MIQNILTFCVKNDLTYVSGSIPSGKLVANDINRNSIYLITPYNEAIVKANFQTNLQSDTPTSVLGILVNGEIEVSELVDTNASYYNLVKDWNIYEFKVPSTTLSFISRNRTGKIGINFSIEQRLVPMIKVSYGTYKGEITELAQTPTENGYYIIKALGYEYEDSIELKSFDLNDILVYNATTDVATKISAYSNRGSTPTAMYSVDPSLLNDNFETIDSGLTAQIVQQVNDNTSDILLLNQGVLNDGVAITDLQNRMSVAEQDIDTAEANITNLQGRMTTAESDIDKIENGTTIVEKALRDSLGNVIKDSYVSAVYPTYNNTTDKLFIETYGVEDVLMANNEVVLPKATTTKNGLMAKEDKAYVDGLPSALLLKENKSEKNQINGYAGLDANAKIPNILLPDSILGQLEYKGTFDPASGYPATPEKGWFYISIGNASISGVDYKIGDWAVYNGSSWDKVDNTDAVASVQGKIGVVVINGTEIQVGNGDTWTIEQRIVDIYAELNNRYTKAQTYSNAEIEQRLTDLLGLANLQDTAIEKSAGVFVFDNGDSILASSLSQYNWVICRFYNVDGGVQNVRYNMFKPSEATSGNRTIVQIDRTPVRYAEIKRDNGNILFRVVDESDTFDNTYVCTMKMWGIKLDGINASEISYDGTISGLSSTNVKTAIDELSSEKADKTYVDSQDLTKADKLVLTNLIPNGGLLVPSISNPNIPNGFISNSSSAVSLTNGIFTFTPTAQYGTLAYPSNGGAIIGNVYYLFAYVKSSSTATVFTGYGYVSSTQKSHSGNNQWELLSSVSTKTTTDNRIEVMTNLTSGFTPIQVDYMGAINLTVAFGAGNEPTKEQMDAIIKLKGYFDTTTINLKDLMLLGFTQETRMTPTLTNATTTYLTYRKDDLGYVDIVGNLTITTFGTNFTFPSGYRPLTQLRLPILTSTNTLGYIIINTDGTVVSNANATIYINSRFATI